MSTGTIRVLDVDITLNLRRERMSNHTPGSWFIQLPPLRSYTDLHIYAKYTEKEEAKFPGSSGKFIATVRKYDVHTQEANASLIAAAPDLLEACQKAYEFIAAMQSFCEENLQVHGWHLNGDPEPFEGFVKNNSDGNELELLFKAISKAQSDDHEKVKLLKSVVFMPPVDDVTDIEKDIRIAKPGEEVIILDRRSMAVQVMFRGMSKWVHNEDLEETIK
jgi:hypothetical protein